MANQPQTNGSQDSSGNQGISLEALGAKITLWGQNHLKHTLIIIGFFVVFYLVFQIEANELYKKVFHGAEYEQKQKFLLHHEVISPIIDAWDTIHDIEDMRKKNVTLVRDQIDDAVLRYESLKVDKLSMAIQITWKYHLARLKVIEADKSSKINALEVAIKWLEEAKLNSNNTSKLTVDDMKFINEKGINTRIKRTLLNSYALLYYISKDKKYLLLSDEILKDVGGCNELASTYFYHEKIAKALNCII
jgi:hypothetical protein